MKKLTFISSIFLLAGCYGLAPAPYDDNRLIQTVSFDNDCPKENVKILQKMGDDGSALAPSGSGQYLIEACGKTIKYKRTGTIYHQADKSPL